jgi:8-oxo-dGTP pyrophosphatase MutT (NUDIX family)
MQVMKLDELVARLEVRLKLPLPGALAHEPIRAVPTGAPLNFEHKLPPKPGSVLILLYEQEGIIRFPLTKRQTYAGAHSDQVSLPGGKTEAGETFIETALRETREEIGIDPSQVKVIGRLSEFFVIPSNFLIIPVVAYCSNPVFKPDPYEVARIITGDVNDLIRKDAVKEKEIVVGNKFNLRASYFDIENEVVWGATAMMLNEFRLILNEVLES